MKIHDLKPAAGLEPAPQARSAAASAARAARPPAAAPRASSARGTVPPGFEGGQMPLHTRASRSSRASTTRSGSSTRSSTSTRSTAIDAGDRGHARDAARARPRRQGRAWSRCSAGASSPRPLTVKAHGFSKSRRGSHRGGGRYASRSCPLPWGDRPPAGQGQPAHQPLDLAILRRRRQVDDQEPACCPACGTCSGSPTCGTRSSSRCSSSRSTGSARTSRCPASTSTRSRSSRTRPKHGGVLGFLDLFSGGALTQFAVFALGIMPYITASIIMQILGVVIPKLEQWQNEGAVGQRRSRSGPATSPSAIALHAVDRPRVRCSTRAAAACSASAATPRAST